MSLKSKFSKKADAAYQRSSTNFLHYLDLQKYNLNKFTFEKEQKDYLFDILPYKIETNKHPDFGKSELDYHLEIWTHNYIGADNGSYLCMKKMFNQNCEICNEFEKMKSKLENDGLGREEVWGEIKSLYPKQRYLYHIIYNNKKYILDISYAMFEKIWKEALDKKKKRGIELFPIYLNEDGCTSLEFSYIPKGQKFYDLVNYDFPTIENYNENYVKDLISLEKLLIVPDQDKIKNSLFGMEDESETKEEQNYYEDVVESEPEEEIEIPVKKKKKVNNNKCPFDTYFGKDWDEYEHCDKCQIEYSENYESCKKVYKEG